MLYWIYNSFNRSLNYLTKKGENTKKLHKLFTCFKVLSIPAFILTIVSTYLIDKDK